MAIVNAPFFIYPRQVADMMSESITYASKRLTRIRSHFGKGSRKLVSITEYAEYEEVDRQEVENYLLKWIANNVADQRERNKLRKVA